MARARGQDPRSIGAYTAGKPGYSGATPPFRIVAVVLAAFDIGLDVLQFVTSRSRGGTAILHCRTASARDGDLPGIGDEASIDVMNNIEIQKGALSASSAPAPVKRRMSLP